MHTISQDGFLFRYRNPVGGPLDVFSLVDVLESALVPVARMRFRRFCVEEAVLALDVADPASSSLFEVASRVPREVASAVSGGRRHLADCSAEVSMFRDGTDVDLLHLVLRCQADDLREALGAVLGVDSVPVKVAQGVPVDLPDGTALRFPGVFWRTPVEGVYGSGWLSSPDAEVLVEDLIPDVEHRAGALVAADATERFGPRGDVSLLTFYEDLGRAVDAALSDSSLVEARAAGLSPVSARSLLGPAGAV